MSNPKWLEKYLRTKPEVERIFDDLDRYREFCVEHGFFFDERHLYNERSPWADFQRKESGKWARDNWYSKPRDLNFRPREHHHRDRDNRNWKR